MITLPDLKPGDLIFVYGTDWISRCIEYFTKSKYSHVAIYIGNEMVFEAQGFRKTGTRSLSYYAGEYDVFRLPMTNEQLQSGLEWLSNEKGIEYDYWDIFVLLMRCAFNLQIPWHECHRLICSRLMRDFLFHCNLPIPDENMTPEDIYEWVIQNYGFPVAA